VFARQALTSLVGSKKSIGLKHFRLDPLLSDIPRHLFIELAQHHTGCVKASISLVNVRFLVKAGIQVPVRQPRAVC
jgi:hypothetical protein